MPKKIQTIDYPVTLSSIFKDAALRSAFKNYCGQNQLAYALDFAFTKKPPASPDNAKAYYKSHYASGARALPALLQYGTLCNAATKLAQKNNWDPRQWKKIHQAAQSIVRKNLLQVVVDDFYDSDSFTPAHNIHFTKKYKVDSNIQQKLGVYKHLKLLNQFIVSLVTNNGQATSLATKLTQKEKMLKGTPPKQLITVAGRYLPKR